MRQRLVIGVAVTVCLIVATAPGAGAIHFYRSTSGGCSPAVGALTDDPAGSGPVAAEVAMMHNSYHDQFSLLPITQIDAGEAVRWSWNSAHCHSVTSAGNFNSGFHYPTPVPFSVNAVPGFFEYPVPDAQPKLTYTRTFPTAGMFTYSCVHHATIGMVGIVIVN